MFSWISLSLMIALTFSTSWAEAGYMTLQRRENAFSGVSCAVLCIFELLQATTLSSTWSQSNSIAWEVIASDLFRVWLTLSTHPWACGCRTDPWTISNKRERIELINQFKSTNKEIWSYQSYFRWQNHSQACSRTLHHGLSEAVGMIHASKWHNPKNSTICSGVLCG